MKIKPPKVGDVDASTFQRQVESLAITLTNKVEREGIEVLARPNYVVTDLGVILRQAVHTYDLLFFLNAEEIRAHSGYRQGYSFAALPLVRTLIDCLYNTTSILEDPKTKGLAFRASGYRQLLQSLDQSEIEYGGQSKWDAHIARQREHLQLDMRSVGITESAARLQPLWPTLSGYLRTPKNTAPTSNQIFLKTLTFGYWAEYSAISHATFQGLKTIAPFLLKDRTPHDNRSVLEDQGFISMTTHLARSAAILLCITTELQVYFRFEGANIGPRMREAWSALSVFEEVQELYQKRYKDLLQLVNT